MIFQTAMDPTTLAEIALRSVRSSITETSTDASMQDGEPVILETATASANGAWVRRSLTETSVQNDLFVGIVRGNAIPHGGVGLAQCYGVGNVRLKEVATVAAGNHFMPALNSTATLLALSGRAAMATVAKGNTDNLYPAGYAVVAIEAATAVSGTTGVTACKAHIRAM